MWLLTTMSWVRVPPRVLQFYNVPVHEVNSDIMRYHAPGMYTESGNVSLDTINLLLRMGPEDEWCRVPMYQRRIAFRSYPCTYRCIGSIRSLYRCRVAIQYLFESRLIPSYQIYRVAFLSVEMSGCRDGSLVYPIRYITLSNSLDRYI